MAAWAVVGGSSASSPPSACAKEIEGEWALGPSGLLMVVWGILMAMILGGLLSIAWLIGLMALLIGVVMIVLAFAARDARLTADRNKRPGA